MKRDLAMKLFLQKKETEFMLAQQNDALPHRTYKEELLFFKLVKAGDPAALEQLECIRQNIARAQLSCNPLRNEQYVFTIIAALLARICIEGNMPLDEAYRLSDIYIQYADTCAHVEEVIALTTEMVAEYTKRMSLRHSAAYSRVVQLCLNYIHAHLQTHITVDALSQQVDRNPTYLSMQFKKETGVSISEYISNRRIEASCLLLMHSNCSTQEIGDSLAFSSNSHFIKVFKKWMGCTPKQYRDRYFQRHENKADTDSEPSPRFRSVTKKDK